ncbi:Imidazole glycerol phosphate synthase subunit HisH [Fundidesulfovibrio magnetotacticus]|uniref:Imidazole glycerol phosphate synthase subunit HisH n=1 Tax=Fundidesulfovibrio magnetotacticus TaxID=2730080 RepID=A0A6V8LVF5_9BACT|nr:imidazole glycerol phosphate synthase subunit HisH [Fundidesulfovibrio magnetotacticus]GFK94288.1 Imidazole glycerol phosphate synthase subunit HisH [Fundidesulfovibrio magnetotacticus]
MLAILDYKAGNQTSVRRALDYLGIPCAITADPETLLSATGVIFPGVGAAGQAMDHLTSTGLDLVLKRIVDAGRPMLGICVGCQILLDYSAENDTKALGIVPGECALFNPGLTEEDGQPIRVPHMGWNKVSLAKPCELFAGVDPDAEFYFVHSYYPAPGPEYVIGRTFYGMEFCSVHGRPGLWAVQFHPEKSGRPGLALLSNFAAYCREKSNAQ